MILFLTKIGAVVLYTAIYNNIFWFCTVNSEKWRKLNEIVNNVYFCFMRHKEKGKWAVTK